MPHRPRLGRRLTQHGTARRRRGRRPPPGRFPLPPRGFTRDDSEDVDLLGAAFLELGLTPAGGSDR